MSETVRPIIIRRKKVYAADGHHGGAWKVAYADFVTAMMAFFLLMWLLNATTEEQRKGIADYFNPNIPIAAVSGGGANALNGDSLFTKDTLASSGTGTPTEKTSINAKDEEPAKDPNKNDSDAYEETAPVEKLNDALAAENEAFLEHISLKHSPEGLVIELVDSQDEPLFSIGNAAPSPLLDQLMQIITQSLGDVENKVKIVGHTDSRVFPNNASYTNWELSADRANTARRLLLKYGFSPQQITEIAGKADTSPVSDDPMAAQNRRISVTLLRAEDA